VTSLIFSQSNYPLKTVIKGDSVVILTVKQADDINNIFESQKAKIAALKLDIATRDSLLAIKEIELIEKIQVIDNFVFDTVIAKRLDIIEHWLLDAGINSTWIYYSWKDTILYAVDLSQYKVRKDDYTGDLIFFRCEEVIIPYEDQEEPPKGWETDIVKPRRPKVTKVPLKM
jgi:hypothetical protein